MLLQLNSAGPMLSWRLLTGRELRKRCLRETSIERTSKPVLSYILYIDFRQSRNVACIPKAIGIGVLGQLGRQFPTMALRGISQWNFLMRSGLTPDSKGSELKAAVMNTKD